MAEFNCRDKGAWTEIIIIFPPTAGLKRRSLLRLLFTICRIVACLYSNSLISLHAASKRDFYIFNLEALIRVGRKSQSGKDGGFPSVFPHVSTMRLSEIGHAQCGHVPIWHCWWFACISLSSRATFIRMRIFKAQRLSPVCLQGGQTCFLFFLFFLFFLLLTQAFTVCRDQR